MTVILTNELAIEMATEKFTFITSSHHIKTSTTRILTSTNRLLMDPAGYDLHWIILSVLKSLLKFNTDLVTIS